MNKLEVISCFAAFFTLFGCNNQVKDETAVDSARPVLSSKKEDTTSLSPVELGLDATADSINSLLHLNKSNLNVDSLIEHYPAYQKVALKSLMEWMKEEWQNTPNPVLATYQGNDFGDYHHVIFKSKSGVEYDFGQATNNYGKYRLYNLSGQYEDNPEFLGKRFKVYWDWKLSEFYCCNGEHDKVKAYLPTIIKLELIDADDLNGTN